jgi:hypothetical protein
MPEDALEGAGNLLVTKRNNLLAAKKNNYSVPPSHKLSLPILKNSN